MARKNIKQNTLNLTFEEVQAASTNGNVVLLKHSTDSHDLLVEIMFMLDLPDEAMVWMERLAVIICEGRTPITQRQAYGVLSRMRKTKFQELKADEAEYRGRYFWKAMQSYDRLITSKAMQTVVKDFLPGEVQSGKEAGS